VASIDATETDWYRVRVDVARAVETAGGEFSDDVIFRLQAVGNGPGSLLLVDDVRLDTFFDGVLIESTPTDTLSNWTRMPFTQKRVASFDVTAFGQAQVVTDMTFDLGGNLPGQENVRLWVDDGDGQFEPGQDTPVGTPAAVENSQVAYSSTVLFTVAQGRTETIFLSSDLPTEFQATFTQWTITAGNRVKLLSGETVQGAFPVASDPVGVLILEDTLPFRFGFESTFAERAENNLRTVVAPTVYPTGNAGQTPPGSGATQRFALAERRAFVDDVAPYRGQHQMSLRFPSGPAVGAIDAHFDLSGYTVGADVIEFEAFYYDYGFDSDDDRFNRLMISLDGGTSWATVSSRIEGSSPSGWQRVWADISADLDAQGMDFSDNMILRLQVGGDQADEIVLFDDIRVYEGGNGVHVYPIEPATNGYITPGATDRLMGGFAISANGQDEEINTLQVSKPGTLQLSEITEIKLFEDDGDRVFDSGDNQLGVLPAGQPTFNGQPLLTVQDGKSTIVWVTYTFTNPATVREDVGVAIPGAGAIILASGNPVTGTFPAQPALTQITRTSDMLPLTYGFESAAPEPISFVVEPGTYPSAQGVGNVVGTKTTTGYGEIAAHGPASLTSPFSGSRHGVIRFADGDAAAAIDINLDLQGNLTTDPLSLRFQWNDDGIDPDPGNFVFVSNDGGATWVAAMAYIDASADDNLWQEVSVDISNALFLAGQRYTDETVIRIQFAGDEATDFAMIDEISVGPPAQAELSRDGEVIPDGGSDDFDFLGVGTVTRLNYSLTNTGGVTMLLDPEVDVRNADNVGQFRIQPETQVIRPDESANILVEFIVLEQGVSSFDLIFKTNDPTLLRGEYGITINALGVTNQAPLIRNIEGTEAAVRKKDGAWEAQAVINSDLGLTFTFSDADETDELSVPKTPKPQNP